MSDVFFYSNKLSGSQESCETSQISDDTVSGGGLKLLIIEDDNKTCDVSLKTEDSGSNHTDSRTSLHANIYCL